MNKTDLAELREQIAVPFPVCLCIQWGCKVRKKNAFLGPVFLKGILTRRRKFGRIPSSGLIGEAGSGRHGIRGFFPLGPWGPGVGAQIELGPRKHRV